MYVYVVKAQDGYVDIDGSTSDPEHFGPYLNKSDAYEAKAYLEKQEQGGYSKVSKMPAFDYVEVVAWEVQEDFSETRVWQ